MRLPVFPSRSALLSRWLPAVLLVATASSATHADDWPQWLGPQRDGVWREKGILEKFPSGGPKIRWRQSVGGGYSGPAVTGGRVYLTDRVLAAGSRDPENLFQKANTPGKERVLCLDEATGKVLWNHAYDCTYGISYPCGPRATPLVHEGKVYTLGAMGDLYCLDAAKGTAIWSKNFPRDYDAPVPVWGFAAHPLLDGDKLICLVGGKGSVAVAFDKDTGKEKWRALTLENAELGYCPPTLIQAGAARQLIIWHPEAVNSLDPETGKLYWSVPFKSKANMSITTPQLAGNQLLVSTFYNGAMCLRLSSDKPGAEMIWRGHARSEQPRDTEGLHTVMATAYIRDGFVYGVCSYGELRCIRLADGQRVWKDLRATGSQKEPTERWGNAFLTQQGDRWFLFNEKGDLIIARLTPQGYEEIDRAHILEPTGRALQRRIVWSHPAYADQRMFVRNDKEIVCVSLAAE
jgi:outer membrane protein assembly factor BamB